VVAIRGTLPIFPRIECWREDFDEALAMAKPGASTAYSASMLFNYGFYDAQRRTAPGCRIRRGHRAGSGMRERKSEDRSHTGPLASRVVWHSLTATLRQRFGGVELLNVYREYVFSKPSPGKGPSRFSTQNREGEGADWDLDGAPRGRDCVKRVRSFEYLFEFRSDMLVAGDRPSRVLVDSLQRRGAHDDLAEAEAQSSWHRVAG